jgi:hypothetical protein
VCPARLNYADMNFKKEVGPMASPYSPIRVS